MKKIKLTQGKHALVDEIDFKWLNLWKWCALKTDTKNNFYVVHGIQNPKTKKISNIRMHRLIMNAPKNKQVDHIDGNGLNNQRKNLRICAPYENYYNRKISKNSISGYKGVYWNKRAKKWRAHIKVQKKNINLGYFDNKKNAAKAYNDYAKKHHGSFANLNKI